MRPEIPDLAGGGSSQAMNEPVKTLQQRLGGASFLWRRSAEDRRTRRSGRGNPRLRTAPRPVCSPGVTPDWSSVA